MGTIPKATALDFLPEETHEPAVTYPLKQAEKFRVLRSLIAEGMDDLAAGRASGWSLQDFLREARKPKMIDGRMDVDEEFQR
jgi:hypothetical protein